MIDPAKRIRFDDDVSGEYGGGDTREVLRVIDSFAEGEWEGCHDAD